MSDTDGAVPPDDAGPPASRRLHPLTPFLRGWKWVAAAVVVLSRDQIGNPDWAQLATIVGAVAVVGFVAGVASWWFTRYRVDGEHLRIDSGVFVRRSRRVRLDRLQAVDVVRPLVARAVGVSELRLEVAGGSRTEAPLAYLSEPDAVALRAELLARAAGLDAGTPEAPERVLHAVPFELLLASTALSWPLVATVLGGVVLTVTAVGTHQVLVVTAALPVLLGLLSVLYDRLVRSFGFTISESPDGLRIRKGLLATTAQTVPPGRVQGLELVEPLPWRWFGWARLEVDVAGYQSSADRESSARSAVLLPVGRRAVAVQLVQSVLGGTEVDAVPLVPAPRRARWLRPLSWRVLAAGADDVVLVTREGLLTRRTMAVPHAKTQSLRLQQGPLQRRLGLANVHVDTTPGPVDAVASHRDAGAARRLVEEQSLRARLGRQVALPERWMDRRRPAQR